ncbi:unnamed protein product [Clonostachys rosea]|uniref:FAD-binding PCMH-type domain-containing protein n=1 Tax=Bionectria ochroleuca TaxID=29856 RepID=A0ABY6UDZ1_BIOOC|nr:unnamed protein product [Clonostachys rosea]
MKTFLRLLPLCAAIASRVEATDPLKDLVPRLSTAARVTTDLSSAPRWSDYAAPKPGYIVHVAEELDVAETVKYCNENNLEFLAQSGGHGGATTFHLGTKDIIINLRGLNSAVVSENKTEMLIGGGALNSEYVAAATSNGVIVLNGGCNCVGVSGLTLGGGLSYWMNEFGMPVDNLISANLVTAEGELIEVSEQKNKDLLWAIRGAGPNFGIVTSLRMKVHPRENVKVWGAQLVFSGDKLEEYLNTMNNLKLSEKMIVHWGLNYIPPGPSSSISAGLLYLDDDADAAEAAFQPLFDIGPEQTTLIGVIDYARMNDGSDDFCEDGGRKPTWLVGLKSLDYPTWQQVSDQLATFVQATNQTASRVFVETYSSDVLREIGSDGASYPHRDINFYAFVQPIYEDSSLDDEADKLGAQVRALWRETDGFDTPRTYINFAHGDEDLVDIYGESLPRLRELKKKWDPANRFDQWFPIV